MTFTLLAVTPAPPTETVVPTGTKFAPVNVTPTVVPRTPLAGAMPPSVGAVPLTVKVWPALEPPIVVTVTVRTPIAAPAATVKVA